VATAQQRPSAAPGFGGAKMQSLPSQIEVINA
jgi:hypothetical protein